MLIVDALIGHSSDNEVICKNRTMYSLMDRGPFIKSCKIFSGSSVTWPVAPGWVYALLLHEQIDISYSE